MPRKWSRREVFACDVPPPAAEQIVHIAGLLVQSRPDAQDALRTAVDALPGAQLHETACSGKLALVLESADERAIADAAQALLHVPGVLTVSVVAHIIESRAALAKDVGA